MSAKKSQGFTLLELIMVIVISGLVAAMANDIIIVPIYSYLDLQRRNLLLTDADTALQQIQRDVQRALPGSIRITGGGTVMEMLPAVASGRYRRELDAAKSSGSGLCDGDPANDSLNLAAADDCFEMLGRLTGFNEQIVAGRYLVIDNPVPATMAVYKEHSLAAIAELADTGIIRFSSFKFPYGSPRQRFLIVDTPVTYRCDTATGRLWRYSGYAIAEIQPNPPAIDGRLQADNIAACRFSYQSAGAFYPALVSVEMALADAKREPIRFFRQIYVASEP